MAVTLNANTSTGFVATSDLSGAMALQTSGATAVTINSSQQVGIGQTSPTSGCLLDVKGGDVRVENTSGAVRYRMVAGSNQYSLESNSSTNALMFIDAAAGAERMRIDSAGSVGIGMTPSAPQITGSGFLQIKNTVDGTAGTGTALWGYGNSSRLINNMYYDRDAGAYKYMATGIGVSMINQTSIGGITTYTAGTGTSGGNISLTAGPYITPTGTSWSNSSDERLKNITGEITNALTKVNQLRAATYTWKSDAENKPQVGLIAQDVQAVLPEVVNSSAYVLGDDTEYLGINYDQTIPLLVAAIKELKAIVDAQATEIAELKSKVGP